MPATPDRHASPTNQALDVTAQPLRPAPRTQDPRKVGFAAGLKAPFKGVGFIARRPNLWLLSMVPATIAIVGAALLGSAAIAWLPGLPSRLVGPASTWYGNVGATVVSIALTVIGVLLSIALAMLLAQPLSGPALERLARAVELDMGAPPRPVVPFWRELGRSAIGSLLGLCAGLPVLAVLTVMSLVLPVTAWVTFPLQILVSGLMVTWDLMDYPFTVRGWSLRRRLAWMRDHLPAVVGFGLSLGIVLLVPCVHVLLLPAGTAGATWLYCTSRRIPAEP
jgi:CysZ protein